MSESTVIAPYATGLAAMIDPAAAARNYERMAGLGARGSYGWYEALDYTRARVPEGAKFVVIRAFMAHHQGMTLVAIANALHDGAMRARFHAEPMIQAAELLLQERMPRDVAVARPPPEQTKAAARPRSLVPEIQRRYTSAHSRMPRTHLLSNGRYSAMLTAAGSGYSRWRDIAITRWREDVTCDGWGAYIFLRDVNGGETLVGGIPAERGRARQPMKSTFSEDRAEITPARRHAARRLRKSWSRRRTTRRFAASRSPISGKQTREIELTSYAELALARQADDVAHPAFAKLFVETEFAPNLGAILATRRRRSSADPRSGRLTWPSSRAKVRRRAVRDRPGAVSWTRSDPPLAGRHYRKLAAVQHGRPGARPDLQPAPSRASFRPARRSMSHSGP